MSGYTATASTSLYDVENDFTFSGTAEAKRTDAGTTNMGLAADQFTNTNPNFSTVTFNVTDGYQTINPITVTVTITGHNNTTNYDGEEHKVTGYDVSISNPLYTQADFTFSGTAEAKRTDTGTTNMGLAADQFTNTNTNFSTVTFNVTDGYQTINPITVTVTITGHNNTTDYDGEEHKVTGYDVQISNPLYTEADFTFSGTAEAARIDAGTTNMGLAADQFANTNTNFSTVTFNVTDGYQTINKINVTVTIVGNNNNYDYDGEEHIVTGYTATASTDLYDVDHDFTYIGTAGASASRTDVGTTEMGLAADQFENVNPNFDTVTFEVTDGYVTINPINVTVTIIGHNNTTDYDGEEHSVSGYDVSISNSLYTANDFTFSGTAEAARTNAGTTNMGLAAEQFTNNNTNFGTVTFNVTDGYQTINPIDVTVTITEHSDEVDYDGEEHTVSGYDFESSTSLYTATDFTFNGTASVSGTDAGSYDMELKPEDFENINNNFSNITFVIVDGQLVIDPIDVTVTITEHSDEVDYDGEEHTVSGYDVESSDPLYTEADFTFSGNDSVSGTDAGSYDMELTSDDFANTNSNFGTVTFVIVDGQLVIDPIDVTVTITEHSDEVDYDGEEHTVSGYDVEISDPLYTEVDFTFSGNDSVSGTDAGSYDMELTSDDFANTNSNFANVTFVIVDGQLVIDPISEPGSQDQVVVTITGHNNTTDYDGEEHSVSGYDVEISNPLYKETDFTFSGTSVAARTDAGTTEMGLAADQFTNNNPNFVSIKFEVTDGYQTITPIDVTVTITGHNSTLPYDGEEHSVSGYDVEISDPLYTEADFTFSGMAVAAQSQAGTDYMGLTEDQFENTNDNFATVTFEVTDGYQTITPIDVTVTITEHSDEVDYDGEEHTVSGYDVEISNPLYTEADFTFGGNDSVSGTDAGSYDMELTSDDFTNTNDNFGTVTFVIVDGQLVINPIDVTVTITGHNNTTDYDGEEHSVSDYDVEISNPLYTEADFTFGGTAEAARTDAGTTEMGLAEDQFENTNGNFATVTFVVTDGYQTINPIDVTVTITGHNNTTDYDGEEHSVSGYDVEISNPLYTEADFTFSGTAEAARTDEGTTYMEMVPDQFENTNDNFATVTFEVTDGYQTINPISGGPDDEDHIVVTITGANSTDDYDGETHTVTGYTATANNELYDVENDFTFSGTDSASQTDVGTMYMGLTADQFANTNTNFTYVEFVVTDGYQTISPKAVTVKATSREFTYNGNEQSDSGYIVEGLEGDDDLTAVVEGSITFPSQSPVANVVKSHTFTAGNANNYTVSYENGELTMKNASVAITITAASQAWDYDGKPHSNPEVTVTSGGLLTGDTLVATATGSVTNVLDTEEGNNPIAEGYKIMHGTEDVTASYVITAVAGTLTINPYSGVDPDTHEERIKVIITGNSSSEKYSGSQHTVSGYTASIQISDSSITYTAGDFGLKNNEKAEAVRTDVGTTYMGLTAGKFENKNPNFENIVFVVENDGYQEVTKRTVIMVSGSGEKVYDGTALTNRTVTVRGDGFVTGEGATYNVTGEQTDVGESDNDFTYKLKSGTNLDNYTITKNEGTLRVTPATLTITTGSAEKIYDGTPLTEGTATITGLVGIETATVAATGSQTDAGESTNTYSITWGTASMGNYWITEQLGTLTITPAVLTITTGSAEKMYDGEPLTEGTATIAGLVNGETATVTATGSQTEVGESANTYSLTWGSAKAANYTVSEQLGTLTVKELEVIEEIDEPDTPLTKNVSTWSLFDLICMLVTSLVGIIMSVSFFKKKEEDEQDEEAVKTTPKEEDEDENKRKWSKFLGIVPGVASIITFILTQNLSGLMVFFDKWSILFAAYVLLNGAMAYLTRNKKPEQEEEVPAEG